MEDIQNPCYCKAEIMINREDKNQTTQSHFSGVNMWILFHCWADWARDATHMPPTCPQYSIEWNQKMAISNAFFFTSIVSLADKCQVDLVDLSLFSHAQHSKTGATDVRQVDIYNILKALVAEGKIGKKKLALVQVDPQIVYLYGDCH